MHSEVGSPQIAQWYLRADKGETFQVTGYDDKSRTIEIQTFDGDLDEIDAEIWPTLPLALAEPPEDWTGPVDDIEVDDLGYSETDMNASDWTQPLQPFRPSEESWEDATPQDEPPAERGPGVAEAAAPRKRQRVAHVR